MENQLRNDEETLQAPWVTVAQEEQDSSSMRMCTIPHKVKEVTVRWKTKDLRDRENTWNNKTKHKSNSSIYGDVLAIRASPNRLIPRNPRFP